MNSFFQFRFLIRLLLIVLVTFGCSYSLITGKPIYLSLGLLLILLIQIINLARYQFNTFDRINYFFESLRNEDFSLTFPINKGDKIIQRLNKNLQRINEQIRKIQINAYSQEQYFKALIEHVGTGILSYDAKGFVIHANNSLKKTLGMRQFTHLKQLEKIDSKLAQSIKSIKQPDQKIINFNGLNGQVNLLVKASSFKNQDQQLTLLSVQDIDQELDERELDSWLKLIRVLTHEIMNSIAPVTSLSENLCNYFIKDGKAISIDEVNDKMIHTTIRGLEIIKEQGQGLIRFVESYRELTRLPKPEKKLVNVKEMLEKNILLSKQCLPNPDIKISIDGPGQDLNIMIDEKQISRVLINLLKNSCEALHDMNNPDIQVVCRENEKRQVEIMVRDNGPGIPAELIDEIFIPFFTTRENGSGIGLSLSRQIMRLHGGSLKVRSKPEEETVFTMTF